MINRKTHYLFLKKKKIVKLKALFLVFQKGLNHDLGSDRFT